MKGAAEHAVEPVMDFAQRASRSALGMQRNITRELADRASKRLSRGLTAEVTASSNILQVQELIIERLVGLRTPGIRQLFEQYAAEAAEDSSEEP